MALLTPQTLSSSPLSNKLSSPGVFYNLSFTVPAREDYPDEPAALQIVAKLPFPRARSLNVAASAFYTERFSGQHPVSRLGRTKSLLTRRQLPGVCASSDAIPAGLGASSGDNGIHKPRRIALFVEPSPFAYISGYKNRFQNFIKYLKEMGDEVIVVTTHEGAPDQFCGAKVVGSWSFPCPWYTVVPLSLALSPRIIMEIAKFKPDIIHASSPGVMVVGALIIAKLLCVPLVLSYHTHVPLYIPKYTFSWLVKPMWWIIKILHRAADLTLVTSSVVGRELQAAGAAAAYKIRLWRKGVDSESFNPRFKSSEMRARLTDGEIDKPLIVHVGRLGAEKNLDFLKKVMEKMPHVRLAFVGDGPWRQELEKLFEGMPVIFTGMLHGEELSQAYASGDAFTTPSESETLGFVVLEAMASGVPIVAARAGGIPDIIPASQEGETGFLFAPGDVDDCVSKLNALLSSEELRQKMGASGRAEVEKHDWRAATRHVRNEEYNAAIWFWQKRRRQLSRWLMWFVRRTPLRGLECSV